MDDNRVPVTGDSGDQHEPGSSPEHNDYPSDVTAEPSSADDEIQLYPESYDGPNVAVEEAPPEPVAGGGGPAEPPASSGGGDGGGGDDEEDEMVKMSFLEHLEELRTRLIRSLIAVGASFIICFAFSEHIYNRLSQPILKVLGDLKMQQTLYFQGPTESFTLYLNLSLVVALFISSPIVLYQVWAFISPGLYKKEKKYAVPFVVFCSALFISGGLFAYFIAFPYALKFLLTFGGQHLTPWITAKEYIDMFWTVIIGLGLIFELPVLMMFLGLIGIVTPGFLIRNFRYAILVIFVVAAVVTPTSDVMNMMIFAVPMIGLFILGLGLVWLVQRKRKSRWVWR